MSTRTLFASSAIALAVAASANANFAVNGDFETGDTTGWQYFPTTGSTFTAVSDANSGAFGAELFNNAPASAAVIKQANVGMGSVNPGDTINISFAAKGSFAAGGVAFAEFFTELAGGGVSSSEILGGAPLALTSDWQTFNFTTTAGPDTSGGITLQLTATTGAAAGSTAVVFYDDIVITPTPGTAGVLGIAGLAAMRRRR